MITTGTDELDFDPEKWIEVPLDLVEHDGSAEEWAASVAVDAATGLENRGEAEGRIRDGALAVSGFAWGNASRRFWYFPLYGTALTIVHVSVVPRELLPDDAIEEFLSFEEHPATDAVITELNTGGSRRMIQVAILARREDLPIHSPVFGVVRVARVEHNQIVVVELIDDDLDVISQMLPDLAGLAESLRTDG